MTMSDTCESPSFSQTCSFPLQVYVLVNKPIFHQVNSFVFYICPLNISNFLSKAFEITEINKFVQVRPCHVVSTKFNINFLYFDA